MLGILLTYKYLIIFPLAIIEGPMVMVVAGFLVSLKILNFYMVLALGVLGDLAGDIIHYLIGRLARKSFIPKYGKYIGITESRLEYAEKYYKNKIWSTIFFSKITHAANSLILIASGAVKSDFKKYALVSFITSIPKVFIFILLGYFFGKSYNLIDYYFGRFAVLMWIVFVLISTFIFLRKKKII